MSLRHDSAIFTHLKAGRRQVRRKLLKIDGYDHSGMTIAQLNCNHDNSTLTTFSAISCLYDNPGPRRCHRRSKQHPDRNCADNQYSNITGEGGHPSINDDTLEVKDSPNEDADNIFSPAYLQKIATQLGAVADYSYPTGTDTSTKFTGGDVFGTTANPKITYVKGDLDIQGNCGGAGIIVVTGNMSGNGGFEFEGLVLFSATDTSPSAALTKRFLAVSSSQRSTPALRRPSGMQPSIFVVEASSILRVTRSEWRRSHVAHERAFMARNHAGG